MFDRIVADGDRTTTGGVVIGRSGCFNEFDKAYAKKGNLATCGNCKGGWPIHGTANSWLDDGLPMVRHMDRVLCPCRKNFVLAAGNSGAFYSEDEDKTVAPACNESFVYGQRFALHDASGSSLASMYYTVGLESGELRHGITDSSGLTDFYETDNPCSIRFFLGHREEA